MRHDLETMIANVQRALGRCEVGLLDIARELEVANRTLHLSYSWPWTYSEWDLRIPTSRNAGTASVAAGSTAVTGVGTDFPVGLTGWRIRFSDAIGDYLVASCASATALTLAQPVQDAVTEATCFLWQEVFEMTDEYDPGSEIALIMPELRYVIPKIPRLTFENIAAAYRAIQTPYPVGYVDHEPVTPGGPMRVRFVPPIVGPASLRLVYRRRPPELQTLTATTNLPEGFDRVLELMAEFALRAQNGFPYAAEAQARADGLLRVLRRSVATAVIDFRAIPRGLPESSFFANGLGVLPSVQAFLE